MPWLCFYIFHHDKIYHLTSCPDQYDYDQWINGFIYSYKLSENIDAQLKRMASDLKEIVEHLNSSSANQDSNDPVRSLATNSSE